MYTWSWRTRRQPRGCPLLLDHCGCNGTPTTIKYNQTYCHKVLLSKHFLARTRRKDYFTWNHFVSCTPLQHWCISFIALTHLATHTLYCRNQPSTIQAHLGWVMSNIHHTNPHCKEDRQSNYPSYSHRENQKLSLKFDLNTHACVHVCNQNHKKQGSRQKGASAM